MEEARKAEDGRLNAAGDTKGGDGTEAEKAEKPEDGERAEAAGPGEAKGGDGTEAGKTGKPEDGERLNAEDGTWRKPGKNQVLCTRNGGGPGPRGAVPYTGITGADPFLSGFHKRLI